MPKSKLNQENVFYTLLCGVFTWWKQLRCKHEKWNCDTQIRTIECRECGKRAWLEEYRSLY